MAKERKPARKDDRVSVFVIKDRADYRDWVNGLSKATLIPVATIVRDALAKWAADRGLPPPPSGPGSESAEAPKRRGRPRPGVVGGDSSE